MLRVLPDDYSRSSPTSTPSPRAACPVRSRFSPDGLSKHLRFADEATNEPKRSPHAGDGPHEQRAPQHQRQAPQRHPMQPSQPHSPSSSSRSQRTASSSGDEWSGEGVPQWLTTPSPTTGGRAERTRAAPRSLLGAAAGPLLGDEGAGEGEKPAAAGELHLPG